MTPFQPRLLGRTGLTVSPLGIGASYNAPASAIESAFERGVNYLYWGSVRRGQFADALRHLKPHRDRMILVMQSFSRIASLIAPSIERALSKIGYDRADVLLLGLWNKPVPERILDAARRVRERGLVRYLAVSSHHRPLIANLAHSSDFDILHFRYNATHSGAETEIFPHLQSPDRPGTVAYTATNWGKLLKTHSAADCYRFALTRREIDICLTGPADAAQLEEALRAIELGAMSDEELASMRRC